MRAGAYRSTILDAVGRRIDLSAEMIAKSLVLQRYWVIEINNNSAVREYYNFLLLFQATPLARFRQHQANARAIQNDTITTVILLPVGLLSILDAGLIRITFSVWRNVEDGVIGTSNMRTLTGTIAYFKLTPALAATEPRIGTMIPRTGSVANSHTLVAPEMETDSEREMNAKINAEMYKVKSNGHDL